MTFSMTGFGQSISEIDGWYINVEIKAQNHKNLDIKFSLPNPIANLELILHKLIKQHLSRGSIFLNLDLKPSESSPAMNIFNTTLFEQRVKEITSIMAPKWNEDKIKEFCLSTPNLWNDPKQFTLDTNTILPEIVKTVEDALHNLNLTRKKEGQILNLALIESLDALENSKIAAAQRAPIRLMEYKKKLNDFFNNLDSPFLLDPLRIEQELAIIADKADVEEEFTRIAAHISALRILLRTNSDPLTCIGKKMDFYLQELNREATTIASKSRDTILTKHTIDIRTLIESMREQVANIQ